MRIIGCDLRARQQTLAALAIEQDQEKQRALFYAATRIALPAIPRDRSFLVC